MKKIHKMNEAAWALGILLCTLGVSLCTKANFGLSMIAAPPYIFHVKLSEIWPWFSQGTAEYVWQAVLLVVMCIVVRRVRFKYFLSFVSAVAFGLCIDGWLFLLGGNTPYVLLPIRILAFVGGVTITALSIAFFFKTTWPLQMAELVVTEIADKFNLNTNVVKLTNDFAMLIISVVSTLVLFQSFVGVGIGTIVITIVNAPLISLFGKLLDKLFVFDSAFKRRSPDDREPK